MKSRNKALLVVLCAMLLVAASVFGTLAYLKDSKSVTNTFTVGSVGIALDEAKVNTKGQPLDTSGKVVDDVAKAARTEEGKGNAYHLLPGHTYVKDPTVTVTAGSDDAYVRMMVQVAKADDTDPVDTKTGLEYLKAAFPQSDYPEFYGPGKIFLLQELCYDADGTNTWNNNKWLFAKFHDSSDPKYPDTYEFRYHTTANGTQGKLEALFTEITIPGKMTNTQLANLENVKIIVTAHAIQADGFVDGPEPDVTAADNAWSAFDNQAN